jgi:hypothetical protein
MVEVEIEGQVRTAVRLSVANKDGKLLWQKIWI